jgi:hypothetical protein
MKIFVSYSSKERPLVNELVADLRDMEHDVWYDQELEGGQKWWDNILENLRAADLVIFALTPTSLESKPCKLEYTYANALRKHIVPVLLKDGVDFNLVPVILQELQIVNYISRDKTCFKTLAGAIRELPPINDLPDPLPQPPAAPISPLASLASEIDDPDLTVEQQAAILHKLKTLLIDADFVDGATALLRQLSQHPALRASILKEIEPLIANAASPASTSRSVQSPKTGPQTTHQPNAGTANLRINRMAGYASLRAFEIIANGELVGKIGNDEERVFTVKAGLQHIFLKFSSTKSNIVEVNLQPDQEAKIICTSDGNFWAGKIHLSVSN